MNRLFGRLTVLLLSASTLILGEFVKEPCKQRLTDAGQQGTLPLYSCGSTSCPPSVKTEATILDRADLPLEGYMVYLSGGRMYKTDLKAFDPQEITGAGTCGSPHPLQFSDDGNWILYCNNEIMKIDGSGKKKLAPLGKVVWLRNSYRGTNDILTLRGDKVSINSVVLSENSAELGSDEVEVSEKLDIRDAFFAAGYKHFTSQNQRSPITHPWGESEDTYNGAFWEIPSTGKTTTGDLFRACPIATFVCAQTFSPDGKLVAANFEHGYQDCLPEQHKGFCVTPVRKFDGPAEDWILQDDISVNFVPAEYELESGETTNLRNGNVPSNDFSYYEWTNKEDWIVGVHYGNNAQVFGAWLVNWKTNQWTLLTDEDTQVSKAAVYITNETTAVRQPRNHSLRRNSSYKSRMLHQWHDVLGREMDVRAADENGTPVGAAGIYLDAYGKTRIVR